MNTNGMLLHCGGQKVDTNAIAAAYTPAPTDTHYPIKHIALLDRVRTQLADCGFGVRDETHALSHDGQRYFGVLQISSPSGGHREDYGWTVGLRNSHDKSFVAGLVAGTRVFVCDNLCFSGEIKIARKHTRHIMRDLGHLTTRAVGRLHDALGLMDERIDRYKDYKMTDTRAHDMLVRAIDARAIVASDLPHVLQEWRKPTHEEFAPRTAWSLFNAFTERHKRLKAPSALINRGDSLHGIFDGLVGLSN